MKRFKLNSRMDSELKHIPQRKGNLDQNMLRCYYNATRRSDLSKDPTKPASETLKEILNHIKKTSPKFIPKFDRKFFKI